jgi:precorrin-6A/cobalt-precorrin-6A reductase
MTVLILGGTGEARALAELLHADKIPLVSSLAGAVSRPRLPVGEVRIGGFGGSGGLADYLQQQRISAVVDATHPFAEGISANAVHACAGAEVPLLRLERPGWTNHPDAASWEWVDDHLAAAEAAARTAGPVLLTTGRRHLESFVRPLAEHEVVVRVVDPVDMPLPRAWKVLQSRGPYDLAGERNLLRTDAIRTLVTKDSGGSLTAAKLDAAAEIDVRVVVVRRPKSTADVRCVDTAGEAAAWVTRPRT